MKYIASTLVLLAALVLFPQATYAAQYSLQWIEVIVDEEGNENDGGILLIEDSRTYSLPLQQARRMAFLGMPPDTFVYGKIYRIGDDSSREYISDIYYGSYFAFERAGVYELDMYEMPVMVTHKSPTKFFAGIFLGEIAYAQEDGFTLAETIRFTVTDANAPTVEECCSSVMFLPGLQASRLYTWTVIDGEKRLWEPGLGDEAESLRLRSGGAGESDVYTRKGDVLDSAYTVNIYGSFIDDLEQLQTDGDIDDFEALAYDWRLDYQDLLTNGREFLGGVVRWRGAAATTSTPYIIQTVRALAADSQTGKVTIVAHSNGGLLAKALTNALGSDADDLIDKIIFVGVPQVGTPKAIAGLLHGVDQALPTNWFPAFFPASDGRAVGQTMPSAFNLLPSARYLESANGPVVTFSPATLPEWNKRYGDIRSWAALKKFMTDTKRTKPDYDDLELPDIVGVSLMDQTFAVHRALDVWAPPAGVEFYTIAGWGIPTLSRLEYEKIPICLSIAYARCIAYGGKISFSVEHTVDGDGTVVEPSAHWGSGNEYWINLERYNDDHIDRTHVDLLEIVDVRSLLDGIISGSDTLLSQYISTTKPPYTGEQERLEFTSYSPVTLGFKDASGNYIGLVQDGTVVGDIPGVYYEQYGDVQWLSVPRSLSGQVVLEGTDEGSFTLVVEETNGVTSERIAVFAGVPSDTNTTASLVLSPGSDPAQLSIDDDGDGDEDGQVAPASNEPVTVAIIKEHVTLARTLGWIATDSYKDLLHKRLEPLPSVGNIRFGITKLNVRGNPQAPSAFQRSAELARVKVFLTEIERGRRNGMLMEQGYLMLLADTDRFINGTSQ